MLPISQVQADYDYSGLMAAGLLGEGPEAPTWPLASMHREYYYKGDILFHAGDRADKLFYISRGSIRLPELNLLVKAGEVIGEMGILSPLNKRTASAICEEDLETYTMDHRQVLQLFRQDPVRAFSLVQLSLKRLIEDLKMEMEATERTRSELRIAHDIQASMLPQGFLDLPQKTEFETYAIMEPAKEVGGDFYDFFSVGKRKLYLLVGDASGKGISAALFMAIAKSLLKSEAKRGLTPDRVISHVNKLLCPDNQRCMFVTVCCLLLDRQTGEVQYCSGGHNPPILCTREGRASFLDSPGGTALGVMPNAKYSSRKTRLEPGDSILLYTDGVTEAFNPSHELFSDKRLLASVTRQHRQSLKQLICGVRAELAAHAQQEPKSDDITMLALRYNGPGTTVEKA
jgi:serine phosphatase RsbU (regulator of sigma subunit)